MIDVFPERAIYREISGKALAKPVAHLRATARGQPDFFLFVVATIRLNSILMGGKYVKIL
jgi:hypothetical protein